jgi:hypothetical protein
VFLAAPRMLAPVMPHLLAELTAPDDARRAHALELAGRLAAGPDDRLERDFPDVLAEFVRRARDQKVPPCSSSCALARMKGC